MLLLPVEISLLEVYYSFVSQKYSIVTASIRINMFSQIFILKHYVNIKMYTLYMW